MLFTISTSVERRFLREGAEYQESKSLWKGGTDRQELKLFHKIPVSGSELVEHQGTGTEEERGKKRMIEGSE